MPAVTVDASLFWSRVAKSDDCWLWQGWTDRKGYGCLQIDNREVKAHRYAYGLCNGPLLDGLFVYQTCGNHACVRPEHLAVRTRGEYLTAFRGMTSDRFWRRVEKLASGCWEWRGRRDAAGYGRVDIKGRNESAHRYAYELEKGPVPDGLELGHLCRNRACVNPAHLEAVTRGVNMERGLRSYRSGLHATCRNGHELTPENWNEKAGRCRLCLRAARRRAYWSRHDLELRDKRNHRLRVKAAKAAAARVEPVHP